MKDNKYKYEHWHSNINMEKILKDLEKLYKKGWIVISHNQNVYGMSVILTRRKNDSRQ